MASTTDHHLKHHHRHPITNLSRFIHSASANLSALVNPKPSLSSNVHLPLLLPDSVLSLDPITNPKSPPPSQSQSSALKNMPSHEPVTGFPSTVRISTGKGGGPAFVGQVFSMCDLSGTGLMAVSTHFDIPFLSKRTPEWLKKIFAAVTKSERNGPVFRFFMDLGDAVSYVKRLNIPSGVVGACRLDIAYEHFKEKPHLFQFVPNEKQVKEANKLLKTMLHGNGRKKVEGVPVFSAENLDIAIATSDGIKWYTPYFFDKNMLDNILEESVDQHFHALIQTRNLQRRRDIIDDNVAAEVVEEMGESMWDPPEVQEMLDEIGHPGIPLSVLSKAVEIHLLHNVDKVLLGNRWLRKATGIQPKFPYVVDSFEKRSTAALVRANKGTNFITEAGFLDNGSPSLVTSEFESKDSSNERHRHMLNFRSRFGDWLRHPWLKQEQPDPSDSERRDVNSIREHGRREAQPSPFLPKITMVGISTGETGQLSKATLKRTMDDLTKELERVENENSTSSTGSDNYEERDPLFVANVGDYYSRVPKARSAQWVRRGSN